MNSELEGLENALATEEGGRKYDVFSFQDPVEVIESVNSERGLCYDIAVVDLTFDNKHKGYAVDGIEVIGAMKEKYPERPVLCCSAYAANAYIRREFRTAKHRPDGVFSKKTHEPSVMLDIVEAHLKTAEKKHGGKLVHVP